MKRRHLSGLLIVILLTIGTKVVAQNDDLSARLRNYFKEYKCKELPQLHPQLVSVSTDAQRRVRIVVSDDFGKQNFTAKDVANIYLKVKKALPKQYRKFSINIQTCGMDLWSLCPDAYLGNNALGEGWGKIEYKGSPWVKNVSKGTDVTLGLYNRHIAIWASHGRYYDATKSKWIWQRPELFETTEDLFTQSFVVPYLMPMLENAGANIFTPRERDWQRHEIIIDNDNAAQGYSEVNGKRAWVTAPGKGFRFHAGRYHDAENPFEAGTARMNMTTKKENQAGFVLYQPVIPETGRYAVYVSYKTIKESVDDAEYIVYHGGQKTVFHVNQKMGGGTWVYLGTFLFEKGYNSRNSVVLSNLSKKNGIVTADAVRFGGGIGNIERAGNTSGMPRALEGARYYAQWAGAPYNIYSLSNGESDYNDDINVRSLMTNWLAGGSPFIPNKEGLSVPLELSLAVHSDAGTRQDIDDIIGTLGICTTDFNDGRLASGVTRMMSKDFAETLLAGLQRDITTVVPNWTIRGLWDRNYSETRRPEVPSSIIELLSHQNFGDMRYGHDPDFKFLVARSLYKSILRYVCAQHGTACMVQPLQPVGFRMSQTGIGQLKLEWEDNIDSLEPTAVPTAYKVYTAKGADDFDNGLVVTEKSLSIKLEQGQLYRFKVTALNRGGESFATPVLAAYLSFADAPTALVVDGFKRVASPAPVLAIKAKDCAFDRISDPGISAGLCATWHGGTQSGFAGFIMGNSFDNSAKHVEALAATKKLNVISCTLDALERKLIEPTKVISILDFAFGLQKADSMALVKYKTFNGNVRQFAQTLMLQGCNILTSGAYIMSDMQESEEREFTTSVLACENPDLTVNSENIANITGLGLQIPVVVEPNEHRYAVSSADVLQPASGAFATMLYADGTTAAVARKTDINRTFTMGFPLEAISDKTIMHAITAGIVNFLLDEQ